MGNEALKPCQLVIELRPRLRIPIGEVDGSDQDSLNRRFNVASLIFSVPASSRRARVFYQRAEGSPVAHSVVAEIFAPPEERL